MKRILSAYNWAILSGYSSSVDIFIPKINNHQSHSRLFHGTDFIKSLTCCFSAFYALNVVLLYYVAGKHQHGLIFCCFSIAKCGYVEQGHFPSAELSNAMEMVSEIWTRRETRNTNLIVSNVVCNWRNRSKAAKQQSSKAVNSNERLYNSMWNIVSRLFAHELPHWTKTNENVYGYFINAHRREQNRKLTLSKNQIKPTLARFRLSLIWHVLTNS